jgi:hypothetical protein
MNNKTQKIIKDIATLTAGITTVTGLHAYYITVINQKEQDELNQKLINLATESVNSLNEIKKNNIYNEYMVNKFLTKSPGWIEKLEILKKAYNKSEPKPKPNLVEIFEGKNVVFNKTIEEIASEIKEFQLECAKLTNSSSEEISNIASGSGSGTNSDLINNSSNSINNYIDNYNNNNNNSLWENYKEFINSYHDWMLTLSLTKQSAIIHIVNSILILLCLSSLITVFYADSLIKYFKIEEKYPRIAKYISLRRKFQQYYFFFNALLIIVFTIIIFVFNILIFIYVE